MLFINAMCYWQAAIYLVTNFALATLQGLLVGLVSCLPQHTCDPSHVACSRQCFHRAGSSLASSINYARLQGHTQALPTSHDHNEIANDHIQLLLLHSLLMSLHGMHFYIYMYVGTIFMSSS